MTELLDFGEHAARLENLYVSCSRLSSLPDTLGRLAALTTLNLGSNAITALPDSLCRLSVLRNLRISCSALTELPESIGHLAMLRSLALMECNALTKLPSSIGKFAALSNLDIWDCGVLTSLPTSVREVASLENLVLFRCERFQELPDLPPTLSFLCVNSCELLNRLPKSLAYLADDAIVSIHHVQSMIFPRILWYAQIGPQNCAKSIREFMQAHHKPMQYLCVLLCAQHAHMQHLSNELWVMMIEGEWSQSEDE